MKMQTAMMMTRKEVKTMKMNVKKALTMTMNDCEDGDEELSIDTLSFVQTAKKSGRAHVVPKLLSYAAKHKKPLYRTFPT